MSDGDPGSSDDTKTRHWLDAFDGSERALREGSTDDLAASGGEADERAVPTPPATLGPYQLIAEIGRGGMGVVYRAFEPELRREVALKLLRRAPSPGNVQRFRDEAQVTAQLQHPGIVPVYALGHGEEGHLYYTMRLVRGPTLEAVVGQQRGRFDGGEREGEGLYSRFELLQVFLTVCRTVAYAHARDVVHRDLKPSNVILGPYGSVHVLDWGLAKLVGSRLRSRPPVEPPASSAPDELALTFPPEAPVRVAEGQLDTRLGQIVGTPVYMAPEQARGDPDSIGAAADVYALGGILYHLLTGRPPRAGADQQVFTALVAGTPPPPPRSVDPTVPRDLEGLCLSALVADPAHRLGSAEALADAVQAYLEGRPLTTSPETDSSFLRTYSSRHYRRPSVSVEVIPIVVPPDGPPEVLLRWREEPPFAACWAIPGALLKLEERLEETARRALRSKAGLRGAAPRLTPLGVFDAVERDPRTRAISHVFLARVAQAVLRPDDVHLAWFALEPGDPVLLTPRSPGPEFPVALAFDHAELLRAALDAVR